MHEHPLPKAGTNGRGTILLLVGMLLAVDASMSVRAAEAKPLLAVIVRSIWHSLHGHESPEFVLYDDGTVVCRRTENEPADTPYQMLKVTAPTAVRGEILGPEFESAKESYLLTDATDDLTTVFWTPEKTVCVYGLRWKPRESWERREWDPAGLRDATLRILAWFGKSGTPWLPEHFEVWLQTRAGPSFTGPAWPADWPQPDLDAQPQTRDGWVRIQLTSEHFPVARKLMPRLSGPPNFVHVADSSIEAAYRIPFPSESPWTDAGQHY